MLKFIAGEDANESMIKDRAVRTTKKTLTGVIEHALLILLDVHVLNWVDNARTITLSLNLSDDTSDWSSST